MFFMYRNRALLNVALKYHVFVPTGLALTSNTSVDPRKKRVSKRARKEFVQLADHEGQRKGIGIYVCVCVERESMPYTTPHRQHLSPVR